jgi:hypothetical protein
MNKKLLSFMLAGISIASVSWAQTESKNNNVEDSPAIYIFDGEKTSFAYGRVMAPDKIAIGLTDEGIYELRGDTAIWLVNHPGRQDELLCRIIDDFMTGNKLFVSTMPDEQMTPLDTLCVYNQHGFMILDKAGNITGTITSDGTIVSMQGKTLLRNLQSVDRLLVAFFFACHYTPVKKQLKLSGRNTIRHFHSNRYAS